MIHDKIISDSLEMFRVTAGINKGVLRELQKLKKYIIKELRKETLTEYQKSRLNKMLKKTTARINDTYQTIYSDVSGDMPEIAEITAKSTAVAITEHFVGEIQSDIPTDKVLEELANRSLVEGATQKTWWKKQGDELAFKFNSIVKSGVVNGLANGPIIKQVSDQLGISARNASSLVHTSVQTVSNNARLKTFQENDDIISGLEWVATLDGHTCKMCIPRDGKKWTLEGKPIGGHGLAFLNPPIHFNDRCVLVPITKTFKELGIDLPEPPVGKRAVAGQGPISANKDFNDFLKRKGKAFQDEMLGPGRADLWRRGVITLRDLVDGAGNELTIKQIKRRHNL
jgi:SPP1 gp7 family putative phage head morphogenesis protein